MGLFYDGDDMDRLNEKSEHEKAAEEHEGVYGDYCS